MRLRSRKSDGRWEIFVRAECFADGERMTRYSAVFGWRFWFFSNLRGPWPDCVSFFRRMGEASPQTLRCPSSQTSPRKRGEGDEAIEPPPASDPLFPPAGNGNGVIDKPLLRA